MEKSKKLEVLVVILAISVFMALTAPTTAIPDISKNPSSLEHHVYAKGYELHYRPLKHPDSFGVTKELIKIE